MNFVIAIAGPPGSGKSAVSRRVVELAGDAGILDFDDFQLATEQPITDIAAWAQRGGNYDELPVAPGLIEGLSSLQRGEAIVEPRGGRRIDAHDLLVFETHYGRAHKATAPFIDWLCWLDVPLDIALARKLRNFAHDFRRAPKPDAPFAWLDDYLDNYLDCVHGLLTQQRERVSQDADQILDGTLSPDPLAAMVLQAVANKRAERGG